MSPRKKSTARIASLEKPMLLERIAKLEVANGMLTASNIVKAQRIEALLVELKTSNEIIANLTAQLEAKP